MSPSCGIVGLPNAGKSTIFNAVTNAGVAAENFPFCTVDPNVALAPVVDDRLQEIADLAKSRNLIGASVRLIDIAGLVPGAASGHGLGNRFLSHIREADAIVNVVRCFSDADVVHVDGDVNPVRDLQTIDTELLLKDIEVCERLAFELQKKVRSGHRHDADQLKMVEKCLAHLNSGHSCRDLEMSNAELEILASFELLTAKPILYVANVDEEVLSGGACAPLELLREHLGERGKDMVILSGKVEAELASLPAEDQQEMLSAVGLETSAVQRLAQACYRLLDLQTFFTAGEKEARAWTITAGTDAKNAARKIHSDISDKFIRAEVISYSNYIACQGEAVARKEGLYRVEGRGYIVKDGDIVLFRHSA